MSEFEHPIKDVTDSLLGWATQAELELAQRLNHPNVTIIGDLDLASDEVERIEKLYGIFLARQLAAGGNLAELTALSPALFLVTLTARAKKLVAADAFSREYLGGIGLSDLVPESQIDSILADKLAEYLTNMQVSAFDTDPVTVLCWHAGFVNTEIPQLLETIDTVAAKHDNPTIDDLELPHYFSGFHQVSPHAAILYQGVMALRDFTITHPQSWFDRDRKHLEPQLPTAIADAVAAELRERPVGTEDRAAAVGVAFYGAGLALGAPPLLFGLILAAAGLGWADVVKTTVLLADIADFKAVNEVYARFFTGPVLPARAAFAVAGLPLGARVEIEAVALRP